MEEKRFGFLVVVGLILRVLGLLIMGIGGLIFLYSLTLLSRPWAGTFLATIGVAAGSFFLGLFVSAFGELLLLLVYIARTNYQSYIALRELGKKDL